MATTRLIRRVFSLLTPITVILAAIFTAQMVNDYVEAQYIGEASATSVKPAVAKTQTQTAPARSKAGAALVNRNMFCSDCETATHDPATAVASAVDGVPETTLPLRLVTTNLSTDPDSSFASIVNTSSGHKGAYWTGQKVPGGGAIERVAGRYVDFHNPATDRVERLRLEMGAAPAAKKPTPSRVSSRSTGLEAEIEAKVRKVNDTTWEVDRSLLQGLISNPRGLPGVRVGPAIKNGKMAGFRVSRLSPRSPVSKIGVKQRDIIRAANGVELNSPDVLLQFVTQIQTLNRVNVTVERGGKQVELTYLLR